MDASRKVIMDDDETPVVNNYLFVIGINQYKDENIPTLNNARKDAEDLVDLLTKYYDFKKENQLILYDEKATLREVSRGFRALVKNIGPNDNLLVYFAGHGYLDKRTNIGYLLPSNAENGEIETYLANSSVVDLIRAIKSKHTLLVLDSCFSGSLLMSRSVDEHEKYLENIEKYPSRIGLAAGMIEKVSDGYHGDNSPFAKSFISFLAHNKQPKVAVSDLIQYVKKTVPNNSRQQPYSGVLYDTGDLQGEFVFYKNLTEKEMWLIANEKDSIDGYKNYLSHFPEGKYEQEAGKKIQIKQNEQQAWKKALSLNTLIGYDDFLIAFPHGAFAKIAKENIRKLTIQTEWEKALKKDNIADYREFLSQFPNTEYTTGAKEAIQRLRQEAINEEIHKKNEIEQENKNKRIKEAELKRKQAIEIEKNKRIKPVKNEEDERDKDEINLEEEVTNPLTESEIVPPEKKELEESTGLKNKTIRIDAKQEKVPIKKEETVFRQSIRVSQRTLNSTNNQEEPPEKEVLIKETKEETEETNQPEKNHYVESLVLPDDLIAEKPLRLLNLAIDTIVVLLIMVATFIFLEKNRTYDYDFPISVESFYALLIIEYLLYYLGLEAFFNGKTIGKLFTGTIVVNPNGETPDFTTLMGRSLFRLIPFDWLSFFGAKGWHDQISGTLVVHAHKLKKYNEQKNI